MVAPAAAVGVGILSSLAYDVLKDTILGKPALAPAPPPEAPKPLPPASYTNNINVPVTINRSFSSSINTYNVNFQSVSPGARVIYVPTGDRVRPQVNNNIKAPSIPPRRLPKTADGQSATKTLRKKSISVAQARSDRLYGVLLNIPVTGKEETVIEYVGGDLPDKVGNASAKNIDNLALWMAQQSGNLTESEAQRLKAMGGGVPFWDTTALILPQFLNGFDGTIGLIYGLEPLHEIASFCRDTSVNARQKVTGLIPKELKVSQAASSLPRRYKEPPTGTQISNTGLTGIAQALEFDWGMSATPEELIKGYGLWQFSKDGKEADFEEKLNKALEDNSFEAFFNKVSGSTDGNRMQIRSLPRLLTFLQSASFFRAGYHRLPQDYPEYLVKDDGNFEKRKQKDILLHDALEITDWQSRQLDAFFGKWGQKIKVKDSDGNDEEICLPNLAEAIAELYALAINVNINSENILQLNVKALAELLKLFTMETLSHDYVVSIAKYLGFNGKTSSENIPISFTPNASSLKELQTPSKIKIIRFKNVDKGIIKEDLATISINAARTASSVFQKWKPGDPLPGERIIDSIEKEKEKYDEQWNKWVTKTNLPTGLEQKDAKATPKIDNIPISKTQDDF